MPSTNCCCLFFASRHSVVLEASLVVTVTVCWGAGTSDASVS